MKNTNDFFSQYNISQDLSIKTDVDYSSNDFGTTGDVLSVTSEFSEGSQLNFDYGLGTIDYNPETPTMSEMPDMMKALDSINIPEMPDSMKMPEQPQMKTDQPQMKSEQPQAKTGQTQNTVADIKAQQQAAAAARHVEQARASFNAHSRMKGSGGPNIYTQPQPRTGQTAYTQQGQTQQQTAYAQQGQTRRQQTYYNQQAQRQQRANNQQAANQAKYARQNAPNLNQEQEYRLKELFTQFYIVNNNKQLSRNVSAWQVLFNEYEDKADFANVKFVDAIVDTLERMEGVDLNVWRYLEQELFRYSDNSPEWASLRNRIQLARNKVGKEGQNWRTVQQNNTNNTGYYNSASAAYARQQMHMASKRAKEEAGAKKAKWTVIFWVIIIIFVVFWIIGEVNESTEPEYDYYYDDYGYDFDVDINYEDLMVEIPSVEVPTITWTSRDSDDFMAKWYRKNYSELSPYRIDINADDNSDKIYFDSKVNKWVVSMYNGEKAIYDYYGTLEDCKKEYPQINEKYAMSCMVDPIENESASGDGETESANRE